MFRLTNHHQGAYCRVLLKLWLLKYSVKIRRCKISSVVWLRHKTELILQRRILTDYFNKHKFSKARQ